jgi:hypothetical protein
MLKPLPAVPPCTPPALPASISSRARAIDPASRLGRSFAKERCMFIIIACYTVPHDGVQQAAM